MKRLLLMAVATLALTACDDTEVEREIGYKGKARINPWLAAEQFTERMDRHVRSMITWTDPQAGDAVWILPASILGNESFTRRMEQWVVDGGHLILLVEYADEETNDWAEDHTPPVLEQAFLAMLERTGFDFKEPSSVRNETTAEEIEFDGMTFNVGAKSKATVAIADGKPGVFASLKTGRGRITVLTDGRLFRNRWIGENEHAALLAALFDATKYSEGAVGFMRGSGLSLWALLCEHLGPMLIGFGLWVLLWLWKNLARFGPLEAVSVPPLMRGYEHHLEALGHFQWRLDRAASLLSPLRQQIVDLGQRTSVRVGRGNEDFHQFLADRAGLSRERVSRALAESAPSDPTAITRTTADLQLLLKVLHTPSQP